MSSVFELSNRRLGQHVEEPEVFAISKYFGIVPANEYFNHRIASKKLDSYKLVEPDDWVYSTIHIDEGSIAVNHLSSSGVVSPMYTTMKWKSNSDSPRFFELLLKSDSALNQYRHAAQGTVNRRRSLSWGVFSQLAFVVPPLDQQQRIVDLMSSVDTYIDSLQKHADACRTARNAVLYELLSAGGDDWTHTTISEIAEVVGGGTPSTTIAEYWDGDIVWLTPTEVTQADGRVISDSARKITEIGLRNSGAKMLPPGSVILTSRASVGFVAISGVRLSTNQGFQSLIPHKDVNPYLLMYWIQRNRHEFEKRAAGSTFQEISKNNVKAIPISIPSPKEQDRIVRIVSSMDDAVRAAEKVVADAKNLRSGLLSDLLSGNHEIPSAYDQLLNAS